MRPGVGNGILVRGIWRTWLWLLRGGDSLPDMESKVSCKEIINLRLTYNPPFSSPLISVEQGIAMWEFEV